MMKYASDFRAESRNALKGKWGTAVLAGFLATLLGAANSGAEVNLNFSESGTNLSIDLGGQTIFSTSQQINPQFAAFMAGTAVFIVIAALAVAVALFILSSVIEVGYSKFNLHLVDRKEAEVNLLFSCFPSWITIAGTNLKKLIFTLLWSLLLIIPGIIASFSYAMTPYIQAENPELSSSEVIERSKAMMEGNRWRLFCLEFSFWGWSLLCILTLGIGNLWLTPYRQAANAAFYREVSGTGHTFGAESAEPYGF